MTQNDKHWQERTDNWIKAQDEQRMKKEKQHLERRQMRSPKYPNK